MERREFVEPTELRPAVTKVARLWSQSTPRFVRNFENAVYRLEAPRPLYLRLTPASHHPLEEVASELEWGRFLGGVGLPIAQPLLSRDGEWVVSVDVAGVSYTACAFQEAPGLAYEEASGVDHGQFFWQAGQLMARIHEAGSRFEPSADFRRFSWRDDRWSGFAEAVPERESAAWSAFEDLMGWVSSLDTSAEGFGMVHGDFTIANLRLDGGELNVFDLDSCCAHWHAYEIAMFLHFFGAREHLRELAYERVLEGYASVRPVGLSLRERVSRFGKLRILYSFLVFAEEWGFDGLSPEQEHYFDVRRRILGGPEIWPQ